LGSGFENPLYAIGKQARIGRHAVEGLDRTAGAVVTGGQIDDTSGPRTNLGLNLVSLDLGIFHCRLQAEVCPSEQKCPAPEKESFFLEELIKKSKPFRNNNSYIVKL
jgi:hypothetical protein